MEYGLIGGVLGQSISPFLHSLLGNNNYEKKALEPDQLAPFLKSRDFSGINVTMPYKQEVIVHIDILDEAAKQIGAVNTIINRNGILHGYNTDYFGFRELLIRTNIKIENNVCVILGAGGSSKTATAVLRDMGAKKIYVASRSAKDGNISYDELYAMKNIEVIINTTPVGMNPDIESAPLDLSKFPKLTAVADIIYNPLKTKLCLQAEALSIKCCGGLYMLCAQAYQAHRLFFGEEPVISLEDLYQKTFRGMQNIVLIGMPSCGKSTVAQLLAKKLKFELRDIDRMIETRYNMSIPEIFEQCGEAVFREYESRMIAEVSRGIKSVIATGGGAVTADKNMELLSQNGLIIYLYRDIKKLSTKDRPLSKNTAAIEDLYAKRRGLYEKYADITVDNNSTLKNTVNIIIKELGIS